MCIQSLSTGSNNTKSKQHHLIAVISKSPITDGTECHPTRIPEKLSPTSKNSTPDCQVWNAKYSIVKQERLCSWMKEGVPNLFKGSLGEF